MTEQYEKEIRFSETDKKFKNLLPQSVLTDNEIDEYKKYLFSLCKNTYRSKYLDGLYIYSYIILLFLSSIIGYYSFDGLIGFSLFLSFVAIAVIVLFSYWGTKKLISKFCDFAIITHTFAKDINTMIDYENNVKKMVNYQTVFKGLVNLTLLFIICCTALYIPLNFL
jgi:hypothetical protein